MNRTDNGGRKFLLVEAADYFDTVLLPRIKKVVYSSEWREGKPTTRRGCPLTFKYIRLESYEDTMDSLVVAPPDRAALDRYPELAEDYRLRYALAEETNDSPCLLGGDFENPFTYTLSVVREGERRETPVDLPETFNLLLGLREASRRRVDGVLAIEGEDPRRERCLILWRDRGATDNAALDRWFAEHRDDFAPFDRVYVNGDHTLNALGAGEGVLDRDDPRAGLPPAHVRGGLSRRRPGCGSRQGHAVPKTEAHARRADRARQLRLPFVRVSLHPGNAAPDGPACSAAGVPPRTPGATPFRCPRSGG